MSCSENPGSCTCGCCSGTSIETPQGEKNLPGLSAINYRTGTWAIFRESMLARLSSADYPALRRLKTRDTDDFSIALLDASAVVLDILTFYQERLANESYLRTAVQIRSLTELARLVGYQPAPGVSAETYLAFTLKAATGLPANPNTTAITIPAGTQVQNVPAQNQKPQYFETSADILAKPDWNALPVTAAIPWIPPGGKGLYLAGTTTHLNPGDALLILGVDRERWSGGPTPNEQWDVVILNQVNVDTTNNVTWAGWNGRLWHDTGSGRSSTVWTTAKIFAFRQRAALFGATAPDPNLFVNPNDTTSTSLTNLIDDSHSPWQWIGFESLSADQIYLDSIYSKIAVGSWLALDIEGTVQLFKAVSVGTTSLSAFGTSARITELAGDFADADVSGFLRRSTTVHAQSEQLTLARQPLDHPLYGTVIDIDVLRPDLVGVEAIAVFGKAQKLAVAASASPLTFIPDNGPDDGSENLTLNPGDIVTLIDPAPLPLNQDGSVPDWILHFQLLFHLLPPKLRVSDQSGRTGSVFAHLNSFTLLDSSKDDPDVQEFGLVSSVLVTTTPYPHTQILLKGSLANVYDRAMTTVNANVGLATAGRSVSEIMGSGSAATPNQRFTLRQSPLTYTQAPTPTGRQTTLTVTANDVKWKEVVPTLYEEKPSSTV
ncbi:MAG TPA: putative baseplate assembly protein, partial [Terracidiphilus sp.]